MTAVCGREAASAVGACARVLEDALWHSGRAGPAQRRGKVRMMELPLVRFESHLGRWARFRLTCSAAR
jgi:hypothetical protein